jgi:drug/metabolite transporter (DMT)-like permease
MQLDELKSENRQTRIMGLWILLIGLAVSGYLVFLPMYDVLQGETTVSYSPFGIYLFLFTFSSSLMLVIFGARGRDFLTNRLTRNWITTGLYILLIMAVGYYLQVRVDGWFNVLGIINSN